MPQTRPTSNERTRIPHRRSNVLDDVRVARSSTSSTPPSLSDDGGALVAALERAGRERAERMRAAAVVVVVRWPLAIGVDDVFSRVVFFDDDDDAPRALVLGRHSEADSPALPGASLRHAVVLAWPAAAGESPRVEVLDLNTDVGLGVVGGGAAAHIESMGPVVFGVGAADVVVVPVAAGAAVAPAGARALLRALAKERPPVRRWRDGASAGGSLSEVLAWHDELARAAARHPVDDGPRVDVKARSFRLPQPVVRIEPRQPLDPVWQRKTVTTSSIISTPLRARALGAQRLDDDDDDTPPKPPIVVAATWAELTDGVLLGRYPRCVAHESIDDEGVSRVHALVVARRQRIYVVDTGSTNGTNLRRPGANTITLDLDRRVRRVEDADELWLHRRRCVIQIDERAGDDAARGH